MTGTNPSFISEKISVVSTRVTRPTLPRSMISGGWFSRVTTIAFFSACSNIPSLPDRPTARAPAWLIWLTISLFTEPTSTISTTFMVASSVTRRPSRNSERISSFSSMFPIWGPPPCTTTGWMPTSLSSAMFRAKAALSASSFMACPPYLMTTVSPWNLRR